VVNLFSEGILLDFHLMWLRIISVIEFFNFSIIITSRGYLSANLRMSFLIWVVGSGGEETLLAERDGSLI
jgi:hypothetical protein